MLIAERSGPLSGIRRHMRTPRAAPEPELVVLGAVIVVGAALRLATLGTQSFWVDEATTVHDVHGSLGVLLHEVRVNETTPPLYFVLAWTWSKLFGTSEVGLRSLSAVCGIGLLPLVYLCARELLSRWASVLAAALAAVSPFLVWYSQEARAYALLALLCAASLLFCLRALRKPSRRFLVLWAGAASLAVLTHFFAGFLIAPEALLLLARVRSRGVVVACAGVAVVQLAVLPLAVGDTSHPLGWITAFPFHTRLEQIPVQFAFASLSQSAIVDAGLVGAAILAVIAAALIVLGGGARERRGAAVAAYLAAGVILVPILLAVLGRDYVVPRNFTPAWVPLALVLAAACTAPRARVGGALLALALLGSFLWAGIRIAGDPAYQRPDWRGVAQALGPATSPRAIVAYDGGFAAQPLAVYLGGIPWSRSAGVPATVSEVDVVASAWQAPADPLPAGTTLIGRRTVPGFLVLRLRLSAPWHLTPTAIGTRAGRLVGPAPAAPAVLVQTVGGHPLA